MFDDYDRAPADELVLRVRIYVSINVAASDPNAIEGAIAGAIDDVVRAHGGVLHAVQVGVSADPAWAGEGPEAWSSGS